MQVLIKLEETVHQEVFYIHCKAGTVNVMKIRQKRDIFLFQVSGLGCKKNLVICFITSLSFSPMPSTVIIMHAKSISLKAGISYLLNA